MWFKYGLKVQKLIAQGNTLGFLLHLLCAL